MTAVLVLGARYGALGVARSLGRLGVPVATRATFPVMLKGLDPRLPQGKRNILIQREEELRRHVAGLPADMHPNLMLQEYIPGGDDSVWMFNGYFNRDGNCPVAFTGRKLRQWPPYHGVTSLGVCAANPIVERIAREFMTRVGYRGVVDIGYRYDARDGRYKLLDVNPRLGATFRLFVAANGMDVARAFYLDMTGQPIPPAPLRGGRKWLLEEDFISFRRYVRDGRLTLREWARSISGVQETAWFAADDPAPFLLWTLNRIAQGIQNRNADAAN